MLSTPTTHKPPPPRGYSAHGAAAEMWRSRATEVVVSGPADQTRLKRVAESVYEQVETRQQTGALQRMLSDARP